MQKVKGKFAVWLVLLVASAVNADYITGVSATAASEAAAWWGAGTTVNGVGWNVYGPGTHTTAGSNYMWLCETWGIYTGTAEITFDLGAVYDVKEAHVWNFNEEPSRGMKDVEIKISEDNTTWTNLGNFVFAIAPGDTSAFTQKVTLNADNVRYIKFKALSNYGDPSGYAGLSEVRFTKATLSRGRRLLLERGIQMDAIAGEPGRINLTDWNDSHFTTLNIFGDANEAESTLASLPAGARWSNTYYIPEGDPTPPYSTEFMAVLSDYLDGFTSFYCDDEIDVRNPDDVEDMAEVFKVWLREYPQTLRCANIIAPDVNSLIGFMAETDVDMILFDYYVGLGGNMPDWLYLMRRWRTAGLGGADNTGAYPIPYGQYAQMFRSSYTANLPSEAFIRSQYFISWAYGYTTVNCFLYNGMMGNCYPTVFGDSSDTKTTAFDYVKEANRQSRNIGQALVRLVSTDVRVIYGKTGGSPNTPQNWGDPWEAGQQNTAGYTDYINSFEHLGSGPTPTYQPADCSNFLIGYFKPLPLDDYTDCTFVNRLTFMIVNMAQGEEFAYDDPAGNRAFESAEWMRVYFNFAGTNFDSLVRISRDTGEVELVPLVDCGNSMYYLLIQLDGGTGDLFAFWNSSDPLPTIPDPLD